MFCEKHVCITLNADFSLIKFFLVLHFFYSYCASWVDSWTLLLFSKLNDCSSFCLGLLRQPKWGHLKDLHRAIKLCEPALVSGAPNKIPLGNYQEVRYHNFSRNQLLYLKLTLELNSSPLSLSYSRLMYLHQMELVLHSLRTTTQNPLPKCHWGICITTFHLGPSAFFPTARTPFIIQRGWESNSWLTFF